MGRSTLSVGNPDSARYRTCPDMLAAGDDPSTILKSFPWLEQEDIQACLVYTSLLARHERIELLPTALPPEACHLLDTCICG